jgi:hypothetical protein
MSPAELDRKFDLHRPSSPEAGKTLDFLRASFKALATLVLEECPKCREQTLAVEAIDHALHMAIGAVIRPPQTPLPERRSCSPRPCGGPSSSASLPR